MKFPSLLKSLNLLKPSSDTASKGSSNSSKEAETNLYDKIEEIVSHADTIGNRPGIVAQFYELTETQQQLMLVTLIEHSMFDIFEVLLLSDCNVNFLIRGNTPLNFAINQQNQTMIRLLIKHNADLEFKDKNDETALNCAVRSGNSDIIKYLLKKGANVNNKASDNSTPLDYAIHHGNVESIALLGQYGAILSSSLSKIT